MAFQFTHSDLIHFLTHEAAAAEISIQDYEEMLLKLWRERESGEPQFPSRDAMMQWFETEQGSQALVEFVYQLNAGEARLRSLHHLQPASEQDKAERALLAQERAAILKQSRLDEIESSLLLAKTSQIARKKKTSKLEARAQEIVVKFLQIEFPENPEVEIKARLQFLEQASNIPVEEMLRLLDFTKPPHPQKVDWEDLNEERITLIEKDLNEGLTPEEASRLQELEDAVFSEIDRVAPLVFPLTSDARR